MLIIKAADDKFENFLKDSKKIEESLGYKVLIYNLNNLSFGVPFYVRNESFIKNGYYNIINNTWKSKSLHKPEIIMNSIDKSNFLIYLDSDAVAVKKIDELKNEDFDIGITVRKEEELLKEKIKTHIDIMGYINAGVIFVRSNKKTKSFLNDWRKLTENLGNDQFALNKILNPNFKKLDENINFEINKMKIKTFSSETYNNYYFPNDCVKNAKILHFKNNLWKSIDLNLFIEKNIF